MVKTRLFFCLALVTVILTGLMVPVSAIEIQAGTVNVSALYLRSEATTESKALDTAKKGDTVVILETLDSWYKVNFAGTQGYMYSDYVDVSDSVDLVIGEGLVTASVVNLRERATTESKVLKQLSNGVAVNIVGVGGGWYKADHNGTTGFIHPDYLEISKNQPGSRSDDLLDISATGSGTGGEIVTYSNQYLGVRYRSGGASPSGFDCSGFVYYVFKNFGYGLPRTASAQLGYGTSVSKDSLQPGDLVFFKDPSYSGSRASHVGIYVGNNDFIHASSPGDVVKITSLGTSYYTKYYIGARRIVN